MSRLIKVFCSVINRYRVKINCLIILFWPLFYSLAVYLLDKLFFDGSVVEFSVGALAGFGFAFTRYLCVSQLFGYLSLTLFLSIFTCFMYVLVTVFIIDESNAPGALDKIRVAPTLVAALFLCLILVRFYLTDPHSYTLRAGFVMSAMSKPLNFYFTHVFILQIPLVLIAVCVKVMIGRLTLRSK